MKKENIALIVGLAVFIGMIFYVGVLVPKARMAATEVRLQGLELAYESCIDLAFENYSGNWDLRCVDDGQAKDCNLPNYLTTDLNETLAEGKDDCLAIYKVKSNVK